MGGAFFAAGVGGLAPQGGAFCGMLGDVVVQAACGSGPVTVVWPTRPVVESG